MSRSMTTAFFPRLRQTPSPAGALHLRVAAADDEFLRQRAFPWAMLATGVLLSLAAPAFTSAFNWLPFLLSLVVFGMPHGAMDWSVRNRLSGSNGLTSQFIGFAPYLSLMALSILFIVVAPIAAFAAFMVLTVFHFGLTDLLATGHAGSGRLKRLLFIAGRGSLILGPAFAFHPAAAWAPFGLICGLATTDGVFIATLGAAGSFITVLGVLFVITHALLTLQSDRVLAVKDLVESTLIALLTTLAAPLFAIGLFFLCTHAYRHSVRLSSSPMDAMDAMDASDRRLPLRLLEMHLASVPLLIPTFIIIPLWCLYQFGSLDPFLLVTATIGFFMISTLPHHLLGLRLPAYRP